jgi:hypothetical protein
MPIAIEEYALPKLTKMKTGYPYVSDKNYNYKNLTICPRHIVARYNGDVDAGTGWKTPGYNPNHNSVRTERINIKTDTTERSLKPY